MDGLLLVDSNLLVWWKKYGETFPYLTQVVCRYLTMTVTSVPQSCRKVLLRGGSGRDSD